MMWRQTGQWWKGSGGIGKYSAEAEIWACDEKQALSEFLKMKKSCVMNTLKYPPVTYRLVTSLCNSYNTLIVSAN